MSMPSRLSLLNQDEAIHAFSAKKRIFAFAESKRADRVNLKRGLGLIEICSGGFSLLVYNNYSPQEPGNHIEYGTY